MLSQLYTVSYNLKNLFTDLDKMQSWYLLILIYKNYLLDTRKPTEGK